MMISLKPYLGAAFAKSESTDEFSLCIRNSLATSDQPAAFPTFSHIAIAECREGDCPNNLLERADVELMKHRAVARERFTA